MSMLWDTKTWKTVSRISLEGPVSAAAFAPGGQNIALAVSGKTERGIRLRNVEYPESAEAAGQKKQDGTDTTNKTDKPAAKKAPPTLNRLLDVGSGNPMTVLWDRQGSRLFVPCSDKTIKVLGFPNGGTLASLTSHEDWVYCGALSPDETLFASGGGDGVVKLWSTVENRLLATLVQSTPLTDQWVIITPKGPFATSESEALQWKTGDGTPADAELVKTLQNREAFQRAMKAPEAQKPNSTGPSPSPTPKPASPTPSPTSSGSATSPKPSESPSSPKQPAPTPSPNPAASPKS